MSPRRPSFDPARVAWVAMAWLGQSSPAWSHEPPVLVAQPSAAASSQASPVSDDGLGARLLRVETEPKWSVPLAHDLALLTTLRVGEAALWPEPFAETRTSVVLERYGRAFSEPPLWDSRRPAFQWDGDPWYLNTVGHALLGSELHLRARTCRHSWAVGAAMAAVGSGIWEYGFEASGVRPSGFDLWYTPLMGAIVGELRYQGWRAARSSSSSFVRVAVTALLDPLGELERAVGTPC